MADKTETRSIVVVVVKKGEAIFHESATRIEISDEGGGEFVEVSQSSRFGSGTIRIDPSEWVDLSNAIDEMIQKCRSET